MTDRPWHRRDRILHLQTPWLRLIGEQLEDNNGQLLDYWRVEKADSVIILPIQQQQLLLPQPSYRPGVGRSTLDFPGGRCPPSRSPQEAAIAILERELGVGVDAIAQLTPLNVEGWPINSSFSNQLLYGFVAHLTPDTRLTADFQGERYPIHPQGIEQLLQQLTCAQCRLVLREWQPHTPHQPKASQPAKS